MERRSRTFPEIPARRTCSPRHPRRLSRSAEHGRRARAGAAAAQRVDSSTRQRDSEPRNRSATPIRGCIDARNSPRERPTRERMPMVREPIQTRVQALPGPLLRTNPQDRSREAPPPKPHPRHPTVSGARPADRIPPRPCDRRRRAPRHSLRRMRLRELPRSRKSKPVSETQIRRAQPGERCTCGRQAVQVFLTDHGETGYCGQPDGGKPGPCVFCGSTERHQGRCPEYVIAGTAI